MLKCPPFSTLAEPWNIMCSNRWAKPVLPGFSCLLPTSYHRFTATSGARGSRDSTTRSPFSSVRRSIGICGKAASALAPRHRGTMVVDRRDGPADVRRPPPSEPRSRDGSQVALESRADRRLVEAREPQEADVVAGRAIGRQVGHDLPDHAAELVAVAAAGNRDAHLRRVRQPVEDEVLVGRVREDAGYHRFGPARAVGEVALREGAQRGLVVGPGRAVRVVGLDRLAEVVVLAELEAVPLDEAAFRAFAEDRESTRVN